MALLYFFMYSLISYLYYAKNGINLYTSIVAFAETRWETIFPSEFISIKKMNRNHFSRQGIDNHFIIYP